MCRDFVYQIMIRQLTPCECKPWKYANRHQNNYGDLEALVLSIKSHSQLQPGLVRLHPKPHDNIQYEVIFGCRRLKACEQLGIPFLVVVQDKLSDQDAAGFQYDENKKRSDSSPYSDALIYRRMLDENVFATDRELANMLGISK